MKNYRLTLKIYVVRIGRRTFQKYQNIEEKIYTQIVGQKQNKSKLQCAFKNIKEISTLATLREINLDFWKFAEF